MPSILIPVPLRKLTNNADTVHVTGTTILEVINNLEQGYPGIKERILNEQGGIRNFVNIYLNDEDVRFFKGQFTEVTDTDFISIVPAIAGG
jgi:molybdopterin synthase sulfur carrier subunit